MCKSLLKYIWLLLILISGSRTIKAEDTIPAILKIYESLDVCGGNNTRQCEISIGIGPVLRTDSLYGYNFKINYNSNKIQFYAGLIINTLAEQFDINNRYVTFHDSAGSGYIMGYGVTFGTTPVYGDEPLYAFSGRYIGSCPDTTYIRLDYLTFTEEFKKTVIDSNIFLMVEAKAQAASRSLTGGFDADTVPDFGADSFAVVNGKIVTDNGLNVDTLDLEISLKNKGQHQIISIEPYSDKVVIDSMSENNNIFSLRIMFLDTIINENILKIKLKELVKQDSIDEVLIRPLKVNECGCIKNLISGSTIIKGVKQDTSHTKGIKEDGNQKLITGYYDFESDEFIIKNNGQIINDIEIFDLQGNLIYMKELNKSRNYINIDAKYYSQGVYFAIIKFLNGENNKIVLIKN